MKSLKHIYKHKGSDTAVFLGSGSSINNISDELWNRIGSYDTWTVNNWVYHPFVPKFYHLEAKKINRQILKERFASRDDYGDVVFIVNRDRKYLLDLIGGCKYIYGYRMHKINAVSKSIIPKYRPSNDPNVLTCNLNSSFTMVLELLCRFKYRRVVLFGVDLRDPLYFWTDRSEYGVTHCQWNKDHQGRRRDQPHNTCHIVKFVRWFSKARMGKVGGQIFVGHEDTALYPGLELLKL